MLVVTIHMGDTWGARGVAALSDAFKYGNCLAKVTFKNVRFRSRSGPSKGRCEGYYTIQSQSALTYQSCPYGHFLVTHY